MISKMKFINLVGPRSEFERIVSDYIIDSSIEFENPLNALRSAEGFSMDTTANPYEDTLKHFIEVLQYANVEFKDVKHHNENLSREEMEQFLEHFNTQLHTLKEKSESLKFEIQHEKEIIDTLTPVLDTNVHLEELAKLSYLKYRFGKLPRSSYQKLGTYLKNLPAYFYALTSDKEFVWGIYFVSEQHSEKVDRIFSTLYFEALLLDGDERGTPAQVIESLKQSMEKKQAELTALQVRLQATLNSQKNDLLRAYANIKYQYDLYSIHRHATVSRNSFCLTGWIDADEVPELSAKIEQDSSCSLIVDEPEAVHHITPPTKLKNWRIFKPFEEFVRMYGVPNYNEMDPTPFLAIVYTLLFGIMFGDVGHGLCLAAIGVVLTLLKKGGFLGKLLIPLGLSSTVFGLLYGSVFGFEGEHALIHPLWFTPFEGSEAMMNTLLYSVILGVVIILLCMIFNIVNGVRQKNWQKVWFSQNGVAGMVFYALVLFCALSILNGSDHPLSLAVILIVVSLILIFLQEPLGKLVAKQKNWIPKDKGGFFLESFFETFEIVLSFVTNTVSFLRVGAFALNHAGMMSVVVMFIYQLNFGGSIAIALFGNLLVIGLEGLIVGIQVLRLGFYEMFSRFYDGGGREFKPTNQ
ncbi:hypothetical protein INF28_03015 [Oscillospiraceae bacterium DSM 107454]|uniref:V-type ATP synthase subunit I n=2 Tax=Ructibacterium gallinarum TaxID=2779355 RepID=A0A9D5RAV0_9FIRM|nr:hypothetical protein [Ructibacterium gallinarum]